MISETDWLGDAAAFPAPNPGGRPAKGHVGRQRKLQCGSCDFIVYATAGAVERAGGRPTFACGGSMHWANERDRLAIEPHELLDEIGVKRFRALCFQSGFSDLAKHLAPTERELGGDRGGSGRCQWRVATAHALRAAATAGSTSS